MVMVILVLIATFLLALCIYDTEPKLRWHYFFIVPLIIVTIFFPPLFPVPFLWYVALSRANEKLRKEQQEP